MSWNVGEYCNSQVQGNFTVKIKYIAYIHRPRSPIYPLIIVWSTDSYKINSLVADKILHIGVGIIDVSLFYFVKLKHNVMQKSEAKTCVL